MKRSADQDEVLINHCGVSLPYRQYTARQEVCGKPNDQGTPLPTCQGDRFINQSTLSLLPGRYRFCFGVPATASSIPGQRFHLIRCLSEAPVQHLHCFGI